MADVKTVDEGAEFPEKRKVDIPKTINKVLEEEKDEADSNKRQKIDTTSAKNGIVSLPDGENVAECDEHLNVAAAAEEEYEEDNEDDEEDYNAEKDEDVNGEAEKVDEKRKGILIDRKGKGKMIEKSEDEDSDDDDSDDSSDSDGDFSDGLDDSDFEDDPLAEVDLDNILPSRTRQRSMHPGVRIFDDSNKGAFGG